MNDINQKGGRVLLSTIWTCPSFFSTILKFNNTKSINASVNHGASYLKKKLMRNKTIKRCGIKSFQTNFQKMYDCFVLDFIIW